MVDRSIRVLLADDSREFLKAACAFLAGIPDVRIAGTATSGAEAIAAAATMTPDLILMDFEMPGMTGLEAARTIKAASPAVKVVIISLREENLLRLEREEATVDGFICKSSFVERTQTLIEGLLTSPRPIVTTAVRLPA